MQRSRVSHHPCHRLSVPSAKRFWCRHCMMVFEDAITRWRHSRSCRSGAFDNHVRRREIETQSLQKMAETLDPEMVTQITVPREDGTSKDLCCFICRQRFVSLDEMREHVRYPCNKPSSVPRTPIPLIFPEPTFGTGIQQHYTDGPVLQSYSRAQQASSSASSSDPQAVTVYMNEGEQQDSEAKPTNIYVNENGETVIEVENLDLNTKSGELSLAHLLTQLSQQGIVFDQQPQGEAEVVTSAQEHQVVQESVQEVDFSQPTAVDAANTLTQLAGSAFRAVNNTQENYIPPVKHIKTEQVKLEYQVEQPSHHPQVQTYVQKEEPYEENASEKYIICTNESDVIRVVHANSVPQEDSSNQIAFQNGDSGPGDPQSTLAKGEVEETVFCQGQPDPSSQATTVVEEEESASAETALTGSQMIVLQHDQPHIVDASTGQILKSEDAPSVQQVIIEEQNPAFVEQQVELGVVAGYASQEGTVVEQMDIGQAPEEGKPCIVMPANSEEVSTSLASDSAVTSLLEMSGMAATTATTTTSKDSSQEALVSEPEPESALLLPHIVAVSSSGTEEPDVSQLVLQQQSTSE